MDRRSFHFRHGGALAALASGMLLLDAAVMATTFILVFEKSGFRILALKEMFKTSPLPLVIYGIWALGVFGTVAALCSIFLYGFRDRWFWRCLVIAAFLWLVFPPLPMIVGVISLIILFRCHRYFLSESIEGRPVPRRL